MVFLKVKICCKFPLDLRCGLPEILGLGMDNLFMNQGCEKLCFFLEERNGNSLLSPFIRSIYEWVLIHVEIENNELFNLDYNK